MHTPTDTGNRTPSPGRNERDSTPQQHVSGTTQFSQFFGRLGTLEHRAASTLPRGAIVATSSVLYPIVDAIMSITEKKCGPRWSTVEMNVGPPDACQGRGTTASSTIVSNSGYRLVCGAVRSDENELGAALDEALAVSIFLTPMVGYSTLVVAVARTRVHMGLLSLLRIATKKGSKTIFSASHGLQPFPSDLQDQLSDANVSMVPFTGPEADGVEYRSDRALQYAITFDAATVTCGFDSAFPEYLSLMLKPICCGIRNYVGKRELAMHTIGCVRIPDVLQLADTYNKKGSKGKVPRCVCRMFSTDNYKRAVAVHKQAGMPFYTYMVCLQSEGTAALDFPPQPRNPAAEEDPFYAKLLLDQGWAPLEYPPSADPFIVCCVHRYVCNGEYGCYPDTIRTLAKLLAIIAVLHDKLKVAHGDICDDTAVQSSTKVDLFCFEHGTSLADGDEVCPAVYTPAAAEFKRFLPKLSDERQQLLKDAPALHARVMDIIGVFMFIWFVGERTAAMNALLTVMSECDVSAGTTTRELLSRILEKSQKDSHSFAKVREVIEQHSLFDKKTIAEVNAVPMEPSW